MKRQSAFSGWWVLALRLVFVVCALFGSAHCRAEDVAVLIEQSPENGGELAGGTGVRYYPLGTYIRLLAVPRPGWYFVYWLGDVVDPLSMNTMVHLDGPMIIVAVYAKIPEDEPESNSPQIGTSQESTGAGIRAGEPTPPPIPPPPPPPPPAEPSTILLFGLAAAMLRRNQRRS